MCHKMIPDTVTSYRRMNDKASQDFMSILKYIVFEVSPAK